jgi:WD40 repeat protein
MKNFEKTLEIPISGFYNSKISKTNNSKLLAVSCSKSVNFYNFESEELIKEIKGHTVNSTLNSFENTAIQSSLENYIAGKNFIFKIEDPKSIKFFQDTLIYIAPEGKTGWVLKNKNQVQEVKLPSFEILNKISLYQTNETSSTKIQLSKKYIFLEYNDSIYVHNSSNNKLVKKFYGQNLALSNDLSLIGFTTNHKINEMNDLEENAIMICKIDSNDTLYYNEKNDYTTSLRFSADSKYFLSLSVIGSYDGYAIVYDIEKSRIIDTVGYEIPNANFTNNNFILFNDALNFDDRNNSFINIRDFINHQNVGTLKGENLQLDYENKYYSTLSNDTIAIYLENELLYKKSFAGHTDVISNILFNSKLNKIISTGLDNQIIVWDLEKGCEIYKLIILENDNWIVQLPNSPFYMSSKNAVNLLNCITNNMGVCDIKAYDLKYNRPNIVLKSISEFFRK